MATKVNLTLADALQSLTFNPVWQYGGDGLHMPRGMLDVIKQRMLDLRIKLREAKRFSLDNDFTKSSVLSAAALPETVKSYSELAYLPFPVCWIEYDNNIRNHTQFQLGSMIQEPTNLHSRAGFLMIREKNSLGNDLPSWSATYVGLANKDNQAWIAPIRYRLRSHFDNGPGVKQSHIELGGVSWGYSLEKNGNKVKEDSANISNGKLGSRFRAAAPVDLEGLVSVEADPYFVTSYKVMVGSEQIIKVISDAVYEGRGDMRWLVSMLTMLNHVPTEYEHVETRGQYHSRLRNISYLNYSVVKITAGATKVVKILDGLVKRTAMRHREHDVRGHNRVLHKGTSFEKTTWVREHKRGDPSLGKVIHDYQVTT
jgi:hypothetical protein